MLQLQGALSITQGVPTAVGSGRQSLRRKMHAVCHSIRMTSPSWEATAALMGTFSTFTGDLGVESGVWTFQESLRTLFGPWVEASDGSSTCAEAGDGENPEYAPVNVPATPFDVQPEQHQRHQGERLDSFNIEPGEAAGVAHDAGQPAAPPPGDPYWVNLTGSIYIAGVLHVIHNTCHDLHDVMLFWSTWLNQLTHISRLVSKRWSKDRLLETCFVDMPQRAGRDTIKACNAPVYTGRWGAVLISVAEILKIEDLLRFAWSKDRFLRGSAERPIAADDEKSTKIEIGHEGITSALFWEYTRMVDTLGETCELLARFAEGCSCHTEALEFEGLSRLKRANVFQERANMDACPMRTLQAPAFAAGKHLDILKTLSRKSNVALLLQPSMRALDHDARSCVLGDFARARQHMSLCFGLRLSFWMQLPWVLFGLGHHAETSARECARRALALYAAAPESYTHHPLSVKLCAPGSLGCVQLQRFANGQASLQELPFLQLEAAKLRFASVSERWIESRHAIAKRYLAAAPHVTATHIAYHGIQKPLRELFATRFDELPALAEACASCRNPTACLRSMGMWQCPAVERLKEANPRWHLNRKFHGALTEILYHVDAYTLHTQLPDAAAADGPEPPAAVAEDGGGGGGPPLAAGPGPRPGSLGTPARPEQSASAGSRPEPGPGPSAPAGGGGGSGGRPCGGGAGATQPAGASGGGGGSSSSGGDWVPKIFPLSLCFFSLSLPLSLSRLLS